MCVWRLFSLSVFILPVRNEQNFLSMSFVLLNWSTLDGNRAQSHLFSEGFY